MLLIETVEPQMPLSIIETFIMEPTHCRPCKLNALPTLAVPLKERLDIMSTKLRTEMLLPHRANERIDTLEPKCKKSMTEVLKQEPSATRPNTLRLEPLLNCVRRDRELPKLEKLSTETVLPNLPILRTERVLPN
jgi:hypothetical protein